MVGAFQPKGRLSIAKRPRTCKNVVLCASEASGIVISLTAPVDAETCRKALVDRGRLLRKIGPNDAGNTNETII